MEFNPETALAYARALARPRLVGSGEDEKVAQEIVAQLESFGYHVEREPFQFTRAFDIMLGVEIAVALVLILCAMLFANIAYVFGGVLFGLLFFSLPINSTIRSNAVMPTGRQARKPDLLQSFCFRLGRIYRTANIVARNWSPEPLIDNPEVVEAEDVPHLYLVAHYDSKSQRMPLVLRIALSVLFMLGVVCFTAGALLPVLVSPYAPLAFGLGVFTIATGIPLLFLDVANASPGALDNAAGTGVVLHLAEVLRSRPDLFSKLRLTILITSAEEMATMGASFHVIWNSQMLEHDAGDRGLYVINFDGTGIDGALYWAAEEVNGILPALIKSAGKEFRIPIRRFVFPGALFDHIPFAEYLFDTVTLMTIGKASWAVHAAGDTPDKLNPRGFEMAGRVAMRVIERVAGW